MRKTSLVAGFAALVLTLSACGGGDDNAAGNGGSGDDGNGSTSVGNLFKDASTLADAASQSTSEKKTAKFDGTMSLGGQDMTYKGEGEFGSEPKVSMTMSMPGGGQEIETRMIGQTMYMNMGGTWMKGDMAELGQGGAQSAEMNDPTKMLEFAQKAGEITDSEETTLDGEPTTHYTLDLDFAKLAEEVGQMTGANKAMFDGVEATIPMEIWLNSEDLPVKVTMDMSEMMKQVAEKAGGNASQMAQGGMTMEMNYTDWGTPVNVEEPPADQVQEMPSSGMPN
ncbi:MULTISPECIES: hypothetical protein [Prauserella salsuginis group]|uniref:Lipoprotein n=2 Tax=Prauserella salsuginis group TaxID=2893672 RepID=A0A839XKX8_9PSEU|nr:MULTISPECIES: hypothetical protein [Prauserella salsuginis group]MBB3663920.1 hypothetical protein [Prauserella sediminis]MCR3721377.1 hypothetical protein [Prauserella flava]MCR3732368.1 hypothetical protein [Prauserella salsuginis]